jgi:hypothetical protein
MRTLVIVAVGLFLIAPPVSEVSAAAYSKTHHRHAKRYVRHARPTSDRQPEYPDAFGWFPHDADKLPIGSPIWWDQMLKENRVRN